MGLPTIGRIVHYTLSEHDVLGISERRRATDMLGNTAEVGQVYPALVVRTFGGSAANLQVFLDGEDQHWVTSRTEGDKPGMWAWPQRS